MKESSHRPLRVWCILGVIQMTVGLGGLKALGHQDLDKRVCVPKVSKFNLLKSRPGSQYRCNLNDSLVDHSTPSKVLSAPVGQAVPIQGLHSKTHSDELDSGPSLGRGLVGHTTPSPIQSRVHTLECRWKATRIKRRKPRRTYHKCGAPKSTKDTEEQETNKVPDPHN